MKEEEKVLDEIDNELSASASQSSNPGDLPVVKKLQLAIDALLQKSNILA